MPYDITFYEKMLRLWKDVHSDLVERNVWAPPYHRIPIVHIAALKLPYEPRELSTQVHSLSERAQAALNDLQTLDWLVLANACPEAEWLLQKLNGAGRVSAYSLLAAARTQSTITPAPLITAEQEELILAAMNGLVVKRYKSAYAGIYSEFVSLQEAYIGLHEGLNQKVSFLEKAAANAKM